MTRRAQCAVCGRPIYLASINPVRPPLWMHTVGLPAGEPIHAAKPAQR